MNLFVMENNLKNILFKNNKTILFVGIGNALKSDDGIGIYVCRNINQSEKIKTLIVESGIEKYIGKINSLKPDLLVLVDCTDFNKPAGFFQLIPIEKVQDFTFHTHTISLRRISEFFRMKTYLLGIQPQNVNFGEEFSPKVLEAADEIIHEINSQI